MPTQDDEILYPYPKEPHRLFNSFTRTVLWILALQITWIGVSFFDDLSWMRGFNQSVFHPLPSIIFVLPFKMHWWFNFSAPLFALLFLNDSSFERSDEAFESLMGTTLFAFLPSFIFLGLFWYPFTLPLEFSFIPTVGAYTFLGLYVGITHKKDTNDAKTAFVKTLKFSLSFALILIIVYGLLYGLIGLMGMGIFHLLFTLPLTKMIRAKVTIYEDYEKPHLEYRSNSPRLYR